MKEGWKYKRLGDLVKICTGKLDANVSDKDGIYPFFTCAEEPLRINNYAYDCECVLVAGNGDLNVKYYQGKFNAYQRTYIIEVKDNNILSTYYLYHFYQLYIDELRKQSVGSTIKYIKLGNLTDSLIPIPSLSEQQSIVEYLDTSFAKIDTMKANAEKSLNEAKALFQSSLKELLTPKEGWEKKTFGDVCWYNRNNGYHKGLRYIGMEHIEQGTGRLISTMSSNEVLSSSFSFKKGDVLYGRLRPYLKKVIVADFDGCCSTEIFPVQSSAIIPPFLKYWFLTDEITNMVNATCAGCRMPRGNMNAVLKFDILFPCIKEQQSIVDTLDSLKSKVDQLQTNCNKILQECDALKQSILKQVFE